MSIHNEEENATGFCSEELYDSDKYSVQLRQCGNNAFKEGKYHEAIQFWLQSVKESLKRSVRFPSAVLYENQLLCRLNLSMGYLKLEEWVEAKEQAELVLEQEPHNIKALYRLAQAFEKIQDWPECLNLLKRIENEIERFTKFQNKKKENAIDNSGIQEQADKSDSEDIPTLDGFSPEKLRRVIFEMRHQIAIEKKKYLEKSKQVYKGISKKLREVGVSENRETSSPKMLKNKALCRKPIPESIEQMKKEIDKSSWPEVSWVYKKQTTPEQFTNDQQDVRTNENKKDDLKKNSNGSHNEKNIDFSDKHKKLQESSTSVKYKKLDSLEEEEEKKKKVSDAANNLIGVPVFKDSLQNETCSDDPSTNLWTQAWTANTLKNDRRVLALSLPLTLLRVIELLISSKNIGKKEEISENACITNKTKLKISLSWTISCQESLVIHVLGARGDVEMESQWTAILRRLPKLKLLTIFFIGFLDKDDRWSQSLREGVLSPPLVKTQDLSPDQKLTCYLYKGMYQTFVKEHSGVLLKQKTIHAFHPDIVVVPEPRLSLYFDSWIPVFDLLLRLSIPLVVTAYSALDFASHDALILPAVIRILKGAWVLPLHSNPFSIKIQPEPECPPMILWAPEGESRVKFNGISAKHAVTGCVVSENFNSHENNQAESWMVKSELKKIKEKLANVCDVDEEAKCMQQVHQEELLHKTNKKTKAF